MKDIVKDLEVYLTSNLVDLSKTPSRMINEITQVQNRQQTTLFTGINNNKG